MNDSLDCPLVGVAATYMPRLSEFASEPGLVAAVDQHAAAVCDALIPTQRRPHDAPTLRRTVRREDLADYVLGFTDGLAEADWADWAEPADRDDFATLRLTAVCWLIREYDLLAR